MRKLALATAISCVVAAPVALAARSSTQFWRNHSHSVTCGKRAQQRGPKQTGFELLCSAKGIPRPKSGHQGGDPFVVLGRVGKAQLVLLSQNEFPSGQPKTLPDGTAWERSDINCTVAHRVKCTNQEGHGFVIGNGKYKSF